jgi:hypothetical protein
VQIPGGAEAHGTLREAQRGDGVIHIFIFHFILNLMYLFIDLFTYLLFIIKVQISGGAQVHGVLRGVQCGHGRSDGCQVPPKESAIPPLDGGPSVRSGGHVRSRHRPRCCSKLRPG